MNPEFGATPWGHGWLRIAEPTTLTRPDSALPKARSLARGDRVTGLDLAPGRIAAQVRERAPRKVTLVFPVWSEEELARARPLLAGSTSTGDLPDELHERLVATGLVVAPGAEEVHSECSCTSRRRPCAHGLAVALEVARRLDERPVLALTLRGAEAARTSIASTTRIPLSAIDPATFYG